jgi:nitroreductase
MSTEALLKHRYGGAPTGASTLPAPNAVLETLLGHRSTRAFLPDALPSGTLELLVAAAQSAPTSSNLQAWSVVAVEDPARRARLSELAANQAFIRQAPLFLCWVADLSRLNRLGQANGTRLEGLDYLESFVVAVVDAALAAQNAVVAAESLGLGTVYVGALRNHIDAVAKELKLPAEAMAVFGLAVGHPDPKVVTAVKPRLPQSLVLHRETYAVREEGPEIAAYDRALASFSEGQGMGPVSWTPRMLKRVASGASLSGRDRLRQLIQGLGFGLR